MVRRTNRSFERITKRDLKKLLRLAESDIQQFFARKPTYAPQYQGKQALVVLAQGAALHYVDGRNGIKDFDVWFFYPKNRLTLPYRRRGVVDFGPSRFGVHPNDLGYTGRRIDVLMRSDPAFCSMHPVDGLKRYLSEGRTASARHLAKKAAVGLWPDSLLGELLWPVRS